MSEETRIITMEQYKEWLQTIEENRLLREKLIQHCPELEPWIELRFPQRFPPKERD